MAAGRMESRPARLHPYVPSAPACRITLETLSFRRGQAFGREVEPGKINVFHRKVREATIFGDPIDAIYALGAVSMNAVAALKLALRFGLRILLRFRHGHIALSVVRVFVCTLSSAVFMQCCTNAIKKTDRTTLGLEIVAIALRRIESIKRANGENRRGGVMFSYPTDKMLSFVLRERVT